MLRQNAGYTRIRVSGYRDPKAKARRHGAALLPLPSWHLHLQLKKETGRKGARGSKQRQGGAGSVQGSACRGAGPKSSPPSGPESLSTLASFHHRPTGTTSNNCHSLLPTTVKLAGLLSDSGSWKDGGKAVSPESERELLATRPPPQG